VVARDVDADLAERADRQRVDVAGRPGAGAGDLEYVAGGLPQDAFGDVAAAGIAGAEDENGWFYLVAVISTLAI